MPKKPMDYSKTIVYKIVCKDDNIKDCYVGHTTNFKNRKNQHKKYSNNNNLDKSHFKLYTTIRENEGWNNWDMVEIERYDCKDIYEARKYEYKWIKELKANLNYVLPYDKDIKECIKERYNSKQKEYREKHKQQLNEKSKEYYQNNKQQLNEKSKEKIQCECGCMITKRLLKEHKRTQKHINIMNSQ